MHPDPIFDCNPHFFHLGIEFVHYKHIHLLVFQSVHRCILLRLPDYKPYFYLYPSNSKLLCQYCNNLGPIQYKLVFDHRDKLVD